MSPRPPPLYPPLREGLWMIKSLKIYFVKILKMREKILWNPLTFLVVFVLYCTKRRCFQTKPQLKVEIKDGREEP